MSKYDDIFSEYNRFSKAIDSFSAYTKLMPKIPDYMTAATRTLQPTIDFVNRLESIQAPFKNIGIAQQNLQKLLGVYDFSALNWALELTLPHANQVAISGIAELSEQAKMLMGFNKSFTDYFSSLQSSFSFIDSLSVVRNQLPVLFYYERNFSNAYQGLYTEILDDSFSPELDEDGDLEWKNENETICSSVIKDIYGLPELFKNISRQDVQELLETLKTQPYTALENGIAKAILNELRTSLAKNLTRIPNGATFLHGRKHSKNEIVFTDDEMMKAPAYCTHTERFNPAGSPAYYLGESIETIQKELKPTTEEKEELELQYIQITTKRPLYVFDIRDRECPVFEFCKYPLKNPSPRPKEYLVPNFIAQCCTQLRKTADIQIDGILYKSTINPSGQCLVLFETNTDYFKITKRDRIPFA